MRIILLKNHRKEIKIKKLKIILILTLLPTNMVNAIEYPEITSDVEIRYKWYKEAVEGDYYPKKDIKEGDLVDETNIKYGKISDFFEEKNCKLSEENYKLEKQLTNIYRKVRDTRYILFENFNYQDNVKIYYNNKLIDFEIISNEMNQLIIDLKKNYISETLLFVIQNAQKYKVSFYTDKDLKNYIISKEINDEMIFSADKSWITPKTTFVDYYTKDKLKNSDLTNKLSQHYECKYQEIYVYKYEIKKEYYDDNYHLNVDGYIKDINDYKIFYKGNPITNIIEITKEKIVKEPQYIYIENQNVKKENDSSEKETTCVPKIKTEIKTKIIEKEIFKTPKKMYLTLILLFIMIIILIIKICRLKKITSIVEQV